MELAGSHRKLTPYKAVLVPPFSQYEVPVNTFYQRSEETLPEFLTRELSVRRLNVIHKHLWLAGRTENIRSLHRQRIIERDIVITEKTELHLVWYKARIYIKPLPSFLLDHTFFAANLCSPDIPLHEKSTLYASACGLLLSYTRLIQHPSDFKIALDTGLLPSHLTWETWCTLACEIRRVPLKTVNRRYWYGELRMTRLNMLYRIMWLDSRGFHHGYTRYASFFRKNFGWLLLAFAYVTVVLAAMQTVLTSSPAVGNHAVQEVSYWFGVGSLVTVAVVLVLMLLIFMGSFSSNLLETLHHARRGQKKIMLGP